MGAAITSKGGVGVGGAPIGVWVGVGMVTAVAVGVGAGVGTEHAALNANTAARIARVGVGIRVD